MSKLLHFLNNILGSPKTIDEFKMRFINKASNNRKKLKRKTKIPKKYGVNKRK
jgi:hypothetical protein